ncbi:hypothetical protein KM043_002150 [Ampulex compressa]|nr:hypothetical protein KM043_002150 [Ampulex compressa]
MHKTERLDEEAAEEAAGVSKEGGSRRRGARGAGQFVGRRRRSRGRAKMQKGAGGLAQYRSGGASAFILFFVRRRVAFVFPRWPTACAWPGSSVTGLLRGVRSGALPDRPDEESVDRRTRNRCAALRAPALSPHGSPSHPLATLRPPSGHPPATLEGHPGTLERLRYWKASSRRLTPSAHRPRRLGGRRIKVAGAMVVRHPSWQTSWKFTFSRRNFRKDTLGNCW